MGRGILKRTDKHMKFFTNTSVDFFKTFLPKSVLEESRIYQAQCQDCGDYYPIINGSIRCNGKIITKCLCSR